MPIRAVNKDGERIWAKEVVPQANNHFTCPSCKAEMSFVNAKLMIKHFRHKVACECDTEPETPEHVWGKETVYETIKAGFEGYVEVEDPIGRMKSDVRWLPQGRKVAFEIQAASYEPSVFDEKITYYTRRGYLIVYLFVGDNFCRTVKDKDNIYSLKEIEKRLFESKHYGDSVIGGYLDEGGVMLPYFFPKFAKGRDGYCENRFILSRTGTKRIPLKLFLRMILEHRINKWFTPPACKHEHIITEKVAQTLTRYKETCDDCDKFVRWIPNKEAIAMGLEL
jgi:transcription elongation factor Elf1